MGNNREVWNAGRNQTVQVTNYYPSGLPWKYETAQIQPYTYNNKEFVEMFGYDSFDYNARIRLGAVPRFTSIDPHAEKYYSISPYAYCANNPIMRIDPTGKYWVGTDGKMVTYRQDKSGKIVLSSNASADLQKYVGLLNESGSISGKAAFKEIHKNQTKVYFVYNTEDYSVHEFGGTLTGLHQPHTKEGIPARYDVENQKFIDEVAFTNNGEYKGATITIFEKTILEGDGGMQYAYDKKYLDTQYKDLSFEIKVIATASHEMKHDTDPQAIQRTKDVQNGVQNNYNYEPAAYQVTKEVIEEYINSK